MNYDEILSALQHASGFDLYRLRAMLDRVLADPKWTLAVRRQLHQGQELVYYDPVANQQHSATLIECRRKDVVVCDHATRQQWVIPYAAINLEGADIRIRESGAAGLSRHEISVGDTVGFLDKEQRQRQGQVIRLNDQTVTLLCDGQNWRVSYALLHRMLEARKK